MMAFTCSICNQKLEKAEVGEHLKTCAGGRFKGRAWTCPGCHLVFVNFSDCQEHRLKHSMEGNPDCTEFG